MTDTDINRAVFASMRWPTVDSFPGTRVYKPRTTLWRDETWNPATDLNETAVMEREIAALGMWDAYLAMLQRMFSDDDGGAGASGRCQAWLAVVDSHGMIGL